MATKGKKRRQLPAEEKLKILEEARQPNTTVAEVLRRHQLDAATFYRWEREAKAAVLGTCGRAPIAPREHTSTPCLSSLWPGSKLTPR